MGTTNSEAFDFRSLRFAKRVNSNTVRRPTALTEAFQIKLPETARSQTRMLNATIETAGVLNLGWILDNAGGSLPRSAIANVIRDATSVELPIWPLVARIATIAVPIAPVLPSRICATSPTGRDDGSAGKNPATRTCTAM